MVTVCTCTLIDVEFCRQQLVTDVASTCRYTIVLCMSVSCVVRQTDKTVYNNNNCLFISFIVCLLFVYTCTHLERRKLHVHVFYSTRTSVQC